MNFSALSNQIFDKCIDNYHLTDNVDAPIQNPYELKSIEFYLYLKNWIDTVQWHLEDIIRNPQIEPVEALQIKRRIDKSNQDRTDLVELIDSYMLDKYKDLEIKADATIKNLNFDGKGYNGYAITTRGAQYLTIEDCTAKDYGYGFVQLASATALTTVKNVTVNNVNYGVKVDYSGAVVIENDAGEVRLERSEISKLTTVFSEK